MNKDILVDLDYGLSVIGVSHRKMEIADAFYMIKKHNEAMERATRGAGRRDD